MQRQQATITNIKEESVSWFDVSVCLSLYISVVVLVAVMLVPFL